ncbi:MAG: UDP-3-O-acyl-N-acetylglucosamine deacetylase, partial [Hyphomicrobiales bacterium]
MNRFVGAQQTTIGCDIVLTGTGVHTGAPVSITLSPADADTGVVFVLRKGGGIVEIPASFEAISGVTLCTVLSDGNGASVATVEHLLAALRGLNIDNVTVEIDSGEVPIMDGSAQAFVDAIDEAGIAELAAPRRFIKVLKPVRVEEGQCFGEIRPHNGFHVDVEIEFDTDVIGKQRFRGEVSPGVFRDQLCRARTFGFMKDVEGLWAAGLALGASL